MPNDSSWTRAALGLRASALAALLTLVTGSPALGGALLSAVYTQSAHGGLVVRPDDPAQRRRNERDHAADYERDHHIRRDGLRRRLAPGTADCDRKHRAVRTEARRDGERWCLRDGSRSYAPESREPHPRASPRPHRELPGLPGLPTAHLRPGARARRPAHRRQPLHRSSRLGSPQTMKRARTKRTRRARTQSEAGAPRWRARLTTPLPRPAAARARAAQRRADWGVPGPAEPLVILTTDRKVHLTVSVAPKPPHTRSATAAQPEPCRPLIAAGSPVGPASQRADPRNHRLRSPSLTRTESPSSRPAP